MKAVDTNIVVRALTRDDPEQVEVVKDVLDEGLIFVPITVLLEVGWVLESRYNMSRTRICRIVRGFLGLSTVRVDEPAKVENALAWYEEGLDFADAFHLAMSQDADTFVTFDQQFIAAASGKGSCTVTQAG